MDRDVLRKRIASVAYNVIFGAKLHFATYDIVGKVPTLFGIATTSFGIYTFAFPNKFTQFVSFVFIVLGLCVWHLNSYTKDRDRYAERGSKLTGMFNNLRALTEKLATAKADEIYQIEAKLNQLDEEFQSLALHQHVTIISNLFAHYKLFFESHSQSDWLVSELNLTFFRDKIPGTLKLLLLLLLLMAVYCVVANLGTLNFLNLSCL